MTDESIGDELISIDLQIKQLADRKKELTETLIEIHGDDFSLETSKGRVVRRHTNVSEWDSSMLMTFIVANNPNTVTLPSWIKYDLRPIMKDFNKLEASERNLYRMASTPKAGYQLKITHLDN